MVRLRVPHRERPEQCAVGALGARPAAFNTVRYSEKLLEENGIDQSRRWTSPRLFGRIRGMEDNEEDAMVKLDAIHEIRADERDSRRGADEDGEARRGDRPLDEKKRTEITAVQCWTAIEDYFGVVPCTVMSMMSNDLAPIACEVDVCGTVAMHALALASGSRVPCSIGTTTTATTPTRPSVSIAGICPSTCLRASDRFPGNHCGNGRQGEHLRNLVGRVKAGSDDVRALHH